MAIHGLWMGDANTKHLLTGMILQKGAVSKLDSSCLFQQTRCYKAIPKSNLITHIIDIKQMSAM